MDHPCFGPSLKVLRRTAVTGLVALMALVTVPAARAAEAPAPLVPALVYDLGGKFDKSFNESAFNGLERFRKETGVAARDLEPGNETQRDQAVAAFARRGANLVIAVGFSQADAVAKAAKEFPNTKFVLIDSVVEGPNVESIVFKEHEGSFLVGIAAALASQTGKVGFIGGMDIPLIRRFAVGYEEGVKYANPKAEVLVNMTGTTPAAWHDPGRGAELARSQFERGADVIYAAAGATGLGVLQAAADGHKLAIGVDSNQNGVHPGSVLTSMVKGVDVAVYTALKEAAAGTWKPGTASLGLAEDGVSYALDDSNKALITPQIKQRLDQARDDIIAGRIKVTDYMARH